MAFCANSFFCPPFFRWQKVSQKNSGQKNAQIPAVRGID
jgi:hypothetical protein